MYDIFFISYRESNLETNWQQLLSFHSDAKRIHGISGINNAHLICNQYSDTEYFFTVDGDNFLLKPLIFNHEITADLILFHSYDALFPEESSSLGSVKLWKKGSIINTEMNYGDFSLFATKTKMISKECFSISQYNASPFDAWKTSFRHCVKLLSCILREKRHSENINMYLDKWKRSKISHEANAEWAYKGYCDALGFVQLYDNDMSKLNLINDYNWLNGYFLNLTNNTNDSRIDDVVNAPVV